MAFLNDIKSKNLSNFILVTIGDDIRISTQNITFDDEYYEPLLLNVPSISESLDIEQRKYRISSVSLNISDYEHNGDRFSNNLNNIMSNEVNIYYSSQTCEVLSDCYLAGTFIIRSFSQDENKVILNCEDLTQEKLHQDFPLEYMPDTDDIITKYRAKPKPMVFGYVDKSPCVIGNLENEQIIITDYNPDENFGYVSDNVYLGNFNYQTSPLYIYYNESYVNIAQHKSTTISLNTVGDANFIKDEMNGYLILDTNLDNDTVNNNLRIIAFRRPKFIYSMVNTHNYTGSASMYSWNLENGIDGDTGTYASLNGDSNIEPNNNFSNESFGSIDPFVGEIGGFANTTYYDESVYYKYFKIILEDVSTINLSDIAIDDDTGEPIDTNTYVYFKFQHETQNEINNNHVKWGISVGNQSPSNLNAVVLDDASTIEYNSDNQAWVTNKTGFFNNIDGSESPVTHLDWDITDGIRDLNIGYISNYHPNGGLGETDILETKSALYDIFVAHSALIKGIDKYNFYTSVEGRKGELATSQNIYQEILSELGFDNIESTIHEELGRYAFTVNKKINSKK